MDWTILVRNLRRTGCGNQQANRLNAGLSAELLREFEGNKCTQAVTEEGEGPVQEWGQPLGKGSDQRREPREGRLHRSSAPPGQFHGADLDIGRQALRPAAKNRGTRS